MNYEIWAKYDTEQADSCEYVTASYDKATRLARELAAEYGATVWVEESEPEACPRCGGDCEGLCQVEIFHGAGY